MDAAKRIDGEIANALRVLLRTAKKDCKKVKKKGTPKSVHRARTSLRRAQVAVEVAMALRIAPAKQASRVRGDLHEVERRLGGLRDDDVLLRAIEVTRHLRAGAGLDDLARLLTKHRNKGFCRIRRTKTGRAFRRAYRFASEIASPKQPRNPARALPVLVRHRVAETLAHAFSGMAAYDTRVAAGIDDEVAHNVRSSARTLRFVLELFEGALPASAPRLVSELRALQARLGNLHDHVFAIRRIGGWLQRGKVSPHPSLVAYLKGREAARDRYRAGFAREWSALAGGFQARLAELGVQPVEESAQLQRHASHVRWLG